VYREDLLFLSEYEVGLVWLKAFFPGDCFTLRFYCMLLGKKYIGRDLIWFIKDG
jgi:hypothetical protein